MAGAPERNTNAAKGKLWRDALTRAIAKLESTGLNGGLDKLATQLVAAAANGEQWALLEIGNRMDGKPAQQVILNGDEEGGPVKIHSIEVKAVDP